MTVMITGAFGLLGTNLGNEYLSAGRKVVAFKNDVSIFIIALPFKRPREWAKSK
jgi:nucleoside-diphosphate-sugar epimerase